MDRRSRACGGSACFFDWRRFAVLVPEAEAAHVPALLAAMPRARVEVMHAELMRVRHFFAFPRSRARSGRADAFDLAMVEAYAKTQLCGVRQMPAVASEPTLRA